MKKIVFVFVLGFFLVSCGGNEASNQGLEVVSTFPDGSVKVDQLIKMTDGEKVAYYKREYYEDGNLHKEGALKNNQMHGVWKSYYKNGLLWSEGEFDEGVRNGFANTFHGNGSRYYEGFYTNNVKDSIWRFWRQDGSFIKEIDYRKK
jgi:antitoxin component YwqK of YwqJK toxin-antitoxin module